MGNEADLHQKPSKNPGRKLVPATAASVNSHWTAKYLEHGS